ARPAGAKKKQGGPEGRPGTVSSVWDRSIRDRRLRIRGRIDLHTAQEVVGRVQRLVVLRVGRDVRLRARLLLARVALQVAAQRGFALGVGLVLQVVRHVLHHLDVRRDALGLDRASGRRVVARRGQPQRAVAGAERDDGLHRALAERARAENGRALVVLQGARDDLGRRSRAAVDQDDERFALDQVAGPRIEALRLVGVAAARRHDLALLQEGVGDRDGLIEQAAGIVAQVEDIALELVLRHLRLDLGDALLQALGGLLVELRQADVADVLALDVPARRAHADDVAVDRDLERLLGALAHDSEPDLGVD